MKKLYTKVSLFKTIARMSLLMGYSFQGLRIYFPYSYSCSSNQNSVTGNSSTQGLLIVFGNHSSRKMFELLFELKFSDFEKF